MTPAEFDKKALGNQYYFINYIIPLEEFSTSKTMITPLQVRYPAHCDDLPLTKLTPRNKRSVSPNFLYSPLQEAEDIISKTFQVLFLKEGYIPRQNVLTINVTKFLFLQLKGIMDPGSIDSM